MRLPLWGALCAVLAVSACASAPEDIHATYTSTARWDGMDCRQLAAENDRIAADVARVTGQQQAKRRTDQAATGVGAILFFPALLALPLTKNHKVELGQLKGEYEAVQRTQEAKRCRGR